MSLLLSRRLLLTRSIALRRCTTASMSFEKRLASLRDTSCNVPESIVPKVGRNLHHIRWHPINNLKRRIEAYFAKNFDSSSGGKFEFFDDLDPVVSTKANFDSLLFPADHVGRSYSDTYYINKQTLLRTHTSAHQSELISKGHRNFLVCGDVYRRDEIDSSHYPVFHQMEGVRLFSKAELSKKGCHSQKDMEAHVVDDLKKTLEGLSVALFGVREARWVDAYFPFTDPSYEYEIFFQDDWLETLGCGVVEPAILHGAVTNRILVPGTEEARVTHADNDDIGWAFGLGLERLAMVLFGIPDVRLFWTDDPRFKEQFKGDDIISFKPYSKYPPCHKDISFWLPSPSDGVPAFHENDLFELIRGVGGDLVEDVRFVSEFTHPKTGRHSMCFRINYRSLDRTLTNSEVDALQEEVRRLAPERLHVEVR